MKEMIKSYIKLLDRRKEIFHQQEKDILEKHTIQFNNMKNQVDHLKNERIKRWKSLHDNIHKLIGNKHRIEKMMNDSKNPTISSGFPVSVEYQEQTKKLFYDITDVINKLEYLYADHGPLNRQCIVDSEKLRNQVIDYTNFLNQEFQNAKHLVGEIMIFQSHITDIHEDLLSLDTMMYENSNDTSLTL